MENIENLYHNFATTLSSSINKFSIEVSTKTSNSRTNALYDQECKDARKEIKQATTNLIKMDKINHCKALIKRKRKMHYLSEKGRKISYTSLRWLLKYFGGKF